jgi:hypothetical protein
MKWEEYISEIELIEKQNNAEHDLYNIIANVLRERLAFKRVSLRDVGDRKRTVEEKEKVFWGLRGFPDFVILSRDYVPIAKSIERSLIYGAVEVKYINKPLLEERRDILQLVGHILWFEKVIYTNGIEWRFYRNPWKYDSIKVQNESYNKFGKNDEKANQIDKILEEYSITDLKYDSFILRVKKEDGKMEWKYKEWKGLTKYLNNYEWI